MNQPNVLLIMTDQQRWDTLGCYGNDIIETPNLDWLASEGTLFSHTYSPSPSCIPARASLLSGLTPWHTGVLGMGRGQGPMGGGFKHTLPGELAKAGYHTQGVGKMHFFPIRSLNGFHHTVLDEQLDEYSKVLDPAFVSDYEQWFDRNAGAAYGIIDHGIGWNSWMARPFHAPEHLHPTNWTVNESIRFLKQRDPGQPFFLKTSFVRPHSPYDPPAYYFDLYMNKELPEPWIGEWSQMHNRPKDACRTDAWRGARSREEVRRARAGYYGSISHIDHQIGRLFDALKMTGQFENTLILFTSDHGDMLGDHYLWRKTYAYEGSAHVPLIVKLPDCMKIEQRERATEPVMLYDIMPSIMDICGLNVPDPIDGVSFKPLLTGPSLSWRKYVHGEHSTCYSEEQEMQFLTDGQFKYIWFPRTGNEQLFDLRQGPQETCDLACHPDYQVELQTWRARLISELAPRDMGLTEGDRLVCQAGRPPIISPNYKERLQRSPVKWLNPEEADLWRI